METKERLTKSEVVKELSQNCDNHVKCLVCGECVTCNLRPCRDTKEHVSMAIELSIKPLGNNTFKVTYPNGERAIRYHHTDIITYKVNGDIVLNSGGWLTSTTKDRMGHLNETGYSIQQSNKVWYLVNRKTGREWTFKDGITIHTDGTIEGNGTDPKELLKIDKDIKKYIEGYIKALFEGKIDKPGPGDCWGCFMKDVETGRQVMGNDHYLSHFEEKYYVPSLLMNAIEVFPVSIAARSLIGYHMMKYEDQKSEWINDIGRIQIKSSLRRYLRRQLGLAA